MKDGLQALFDTSYLSGGSAAYIEDLYEQYLDDPDSVDTAWREKFDAFDGGKGGKEIRHSEVREYFRELGLSRRGQAAATESQVADPKQVKVLHLIEAYRAQGHGHANIDPLGMWQHPYRTDLSLANFNLSDSDLDTTFNAGDLHGPDERTLREILKELKETYAGSIGAEFMHINDTQERTWIQNKLESSRAHQSFSEEEKREILKGLTAAEGLEKYIGAKFPGAKRFSLEGGDSFIPMLQDLVQQSGKFGGRELVLGMAHRGRLNVLVNLVGKQPSELFDEFAGKHINHKGSGDVKYHQGFSSDIKTPGGTVHVALAFNPSHLEIVSPVVEGSVRSRQERRNDDDYSQVLPVNVHGDAAFTGQGVVMETFNMSQARGFMTGGTVHIVINNQVGFTTSNPDDARSTAYCTDVAKMVEAPIFHVNGDDPESVIFVTRLALEYRNKFNKDVVIDLVCYRRQGHNEADEPSATQPVMYKKIKSHPTTRKIYAEKLKDAGVVSGEQISELVDWYRDRLDEGKNVVSHWLPQEQHEFTVDWHPYLNQEWTAKADTTISKKDFDSLADAITRYPDDLKLNSRVRKIMDERVKMKNGDIAMDWGFAETMAYASLLNENFSVRLCGQDSGRGTFFHRHAVLHGQEQGRTWIPLQHISDSQPNFTVIDSVLSEEAVLAFEYGYATNDPKALVIWEAQFGDFVNGAQVVIDQFISSGESKWGRLAGLVMLLPHGYEGQGPEHSSARLERFLQLCAEQNMQVCVPSTPAQVFHMLRRQMIRPLRTPLIVMSPKSLLRHKLAVSSIDELTSGDYQNVIDEIDDLDPAKVSRVVMCSGKVYYDLLEKRREADKQDTAIIRIEQLYPFPEDALKLALASYSKAKDYIWCQEEPKNQGAWYSSRHNFQACVPDGVEVQYAGREAAAAPAVGYMDLHNKQQSALVHEALDLSES